jgi:hypothetical protein
MTRALPLQVFVEALLYGAPRQLMLENDYVQRGPYLAGKPATHMGRWSSGHSLATQCSQVPRCCAQDVCCFTHSYCSTAGHRHAH